MADETMAEEVTFEQVIEVNWKGDEADFEFIKVETKSGVTGTIAEFILVWDEHYPISHSMTKTENMKLYNLLLRAGEMFRLLRKLDNLEARELVKKIEQAEH